MSYTLEDFKADHDLDQKTIDERKEQLLEEMRLYELKEARTQQDVTQPLAAGFRSTRSCRTGAPCNWSEIR